MRQVLSPRGLAELRRFASSNVLLGFDFDGTLAPIVTDPQAARLSDAVRRHLVRLTRRYPCVVISGRSRDDLHARVEGLGFRAAIGSHGADLSPHSTRYRHLVRRWRAELDSGIGAHPGIQIEDKATSLSVHYRRARSKSTARRIVGDAVARLDRARIVPGKQVVNVVPEGAPDKGRALRAQCDRLRCRFAIYVGDDDTDEDVFRLADRGDLLAVRVGYSRASHATHYLKNQRAVPSFLERLAAFRVTGRRGQHE